MNTRTQSQTQAFNRDILIPDSAGVYIPQEFATCFGMEDNFHNYAEIKEALEYLKQVEDVHTDEHYWETWDFILSNARIHLKTGETGYLYHNGDLWLLDIRDNGDGLDY